MKIVFAGTPEFAVPCLSALLHSRHDLVGVYTQPDRPAGRGRHLQASPIKQMALEHNIPVYQPASLKSAEEQTRLAELRPDVMVVVAYGLLLPQAVLDIPSKGCINVHASILPRWRGAAPIQRAIMAGDLESGVCIMQMEAGLDTGPVLLCQTTLIGKHDTAGDLHDKLSLLGASALLQGLDAIELGVAKRIAQDDTKATYAAKINKSDACLDFFTTSEECWRVTKAFSPWPIAYTYLAGVAVRVHRAEVAALMLLNSEYLPGTIIEVSPKGIEVACGKGSVRFTDIQLPGAKVLAVSDVIRGHPALFAPGMRFERA